MRKYLWALFIAVAAVFLFGEVALAQPAADPAAATASASPFAALTAFESSGAQIVTAVGVLLLALAGLSKALGFFVGIAAAFAPRLRPVAAWLVKWSTELHTIGQKIGDQVPGSVGHTAKMQAMRAAAAPRNTPITVPPPRNTRPPTPPPALPPAAGLILVLALSALCATTTTGCAAFASLANKNPIVVAQSFEQAVTVADDIAKEAWMVALPLLPAADQAQAEADFTKTQGALDHALAALNDGVKGYEDGQAQNWTALYGDVAAAVDQLVALVNEFGAPKAGGSQTRLMSPAFASRSADLARAVATVHRYH